MCLQKLNFFARLGARGELKILTPYQILLDYSFARFSGLRCFKNWIWVLVGNERGPNARGGEFSLFEMECMVGKKWKNF